MIHILFPLIPCDKHELDKNHFFLQVSDKEKHYLHISIKWTRTQIVCHYTNSFIWPLEDGQLVHISFYQYYHGDWGFWPLKSRLKVTFQPCLLEDYTCCSQNCKQWGNQTYFLPWIFSFSVLNVGSTWHVFQKGVWTIYQHGVSLNYHPILIWHEQIEPV